MNQLINKSAELRNNALLYQEQKKYRQAIATYIQYTNTLKHVQAADYNMLGCMLNLLYMEQSHDTADAQRSLYYFEKASDIQPDKKLYSKNGTIMASKCNDYVKGRKLWDRILKYNEMNNDDKYDYAAFCLKTKDFEGWYKYFGFRFQKETSPTKFPDLSCLPCWDGSQDLKGKKLLVYYEQGFGDTFLMWGYMPLLKELTDDITFVVQKQIYPLFKNNRYGVKVIPNNGQRLTLEANYYIPSMSIPIALKLAGDKLNTGKGFIDVDKEKKDYYYNKYFKDVKELKIGLSVRGSVTGDTSRDIKSEDLKYLDKVNGIKLYNLTKDVDKNFYNKLKKNKVTDLSNEFESFLDTACIMDNMDIIISTDNVLLNLAGGLGKKTYGLFNWQNQFRWFDLTGPDVKWLSSVKPFVNNKQDNWSNSIQKAIKELRKELNKKERKG